jgi:hypothetical protein
MKMSPYFADLLPIYVAEIEDLTTDSGGGDVLHARLREKRAQVPDLLLMIDSNPEMLAVVFHKSISVKSRPAIVRILSSEPDEFPSWDSVAGSVQFASWATGLVGQIQAAPGGEQFLLTTVALEYLHGLHEISEQEAGEIDSDDDDESEDLAEAGDQWLSEQGFDSQN